MSPGPWRPVNVVAAPARAPAKKRPNGTTAPTKSVERPVPALEARVASVVKSWSISALRDQGRAAARSVPRAPGRVRTAETSMSLRGRQRRRCRWRRSRPVARWRRCARRGPPAPTATPIPKWWSSHGACTRRRRPPGSWNRSGPPRTPPGELEREAVRSVAGAPAARTGAGERRASDRQGRRRARASAPPARRARAPQRPRARAASPPRCAG